MIVPPRGRIPQISRDVERREARPRRARASPSRDADDLVAAVERAARDGADDGVQPGAVAAAGEDADALHRRLSLRRASRDAAGGIRTHTSRRTMDFESIASASCATAAGATNCRDGRCRPPSISRNNPFQLAAPRGDPDRRRDACRACAASTARRRSRSSRSCSSRSSPSGCSSTWSKAPSALLRPVHLIGLTPGLRLRARRARLLARLRHPRADQLRPRRRLHARRDDLGHRSLVGLPSQAAHGERASGRRSFSMLAGHDGRLRR